MTKIKRALVAAAALTLLAGGTAVAVSTTASADTTVRWIAVHGASTSETEQGTYVNVIQNHQNPSYVGTYILRGSFARTAGCSYRVSEDITGDVRNEDGVGAPQAGLSFAPDGILEYGLWFRPPAEGYAQAIAFVVGKCADGSWELGNIEWLRQDDGTVTQGPRPPMGPLDPESAQRIWDEGRGRS